MPLVWCLIVNLPDFTMAENNCLADSLCCLTQWLSRIIYLNFLLFIKVIIFSTVSSLKFFLKRNKSLSRGKLPKSRPITSSLVVQSVRSGVFFGTIFFSWRYPWSSFFDAHDSPGGQGCVWKNSFGRPAVIITAIRIPIMVIIVMTRLFCGMIVTASVVRRTTGMEKKSQNRCGNSLMGNRFPSTPASVKINHVMMTSQKLDV